MGIHQKSVLFAGSRAGVALDAFHSLNAPGSFVAVNGNGVGGALFLTEAAEDAVIDVDGHMTTGRIGDLRGFCGIHEGSRLTKQASQ